MLRSHVPGRAPYPGRAPLEVPEADRTVEAAAGEHANRLKRTDQCLARGRARLEQGAVGARQIYHPSSPGWLYESLRRPGDSRPCAMAPSTRTSADGDAPDPQPVVRRLSARPSCYLSGRHASVGEGAQRAVSRRSHSMRPSVPRRRAAPIRWKPLAPSPCCGLSASQLGINRLLAARRSTGGRCRASTPGAVKTERDSFKISAPSAIREALHRARAVPLPCKAGGFPMLLLLLEDVLLGPRGDDALDLGAIFARGPIETGPRPSGGRACGVSVQLSSAGPPRGAVAAPDASWRRVLTVRRRPKRAAVRWSGES